MGQIDNAVSLAVWSNISIQGSDECWPFMGPRIRKGYGYHLHKGRMYMTHRVAYATKRGDIPAGKLVMHVCDNPACCNPAHLKVGTNLDNMHDKMAKGRQQFGQRVGTSKLLDSQVAYMKLLLANGVPPVEVAKCYGVTRQYCYMVRDGKWQKHVPAAPLIPFGSLPVPYQSKKQ